MKQLVTCICILTVVTSCKLTTQRGDSQSQEQHVGTTSETIANDAEVITVFFTGNELGELKPCGCFGGQLGGLERRTAVFNSAPKDKRIIIDTGTLVKDDGEQDVIKFNILFQALNLLGYDLLSLSEKDIEIISDHFVTLDDFEPAFDIIAPMGTSSLDSPAIFSKTLQLDGKPISVSVLAFNVDSMSIDHIGEFFFPFEIEFDGYQVNILIPNRCDSQVIASIAAKAPFIDCIVSPSETDEPMLLSEPNQVPLVFSTGKFGRYITKLQIEPAKGEQININFETQAVTEDIPQDMYLISLYKDYQQIVAERNLLEEYPRFILPDGLKYEGSDSCVNCHELEHESEFFVWMNSAHANAYATLEEVGSQYDPECLICHVVGMEYQSGFFSESKTPLLRDVGCEVCHGPGSAHIKDPYEVKMPISEPKSVCSECHTPDHDGSYAGHEQEKLELIKHWTEPNEPNSVK